MQREKLTNANGAHSRISVLFDILFRLNRLVLILFLRIFIWIFYWCSATAYHLDNFSDQVLYEDDGLLDTVD